LSNCRMVAGFGSFFILLFFLRLRWAGVQLKIVKISAEFLIFAA
jgi:hypothetical protein